ncbi:MAG TPA: tetratricopeptide repeat protein [Acidobacteriota bacterium]|nr:tetratricopeptide repeat protein [Acidobacteriota bacterium]
MKSLAFSIAFLLLFSGLLLTADDPAKGHYESAQIFMRDGKFQQALDDLNFIVKSFPQNPLADDALLQLGMYYMDNQKDLDQALTFFQQIKDKYTESNSAPAAYYYLGQIYLARRDAKDLDEAYADFERVTRVFPSSAWVDRSLVGAGTALKLRGEFDKAYEEFAKVKVRFADSPQAPRAQYEMGICALYGQSYVEAAYDFQQLIDQFPDSELARPARQLNTIIYRLYLAPQTDKRTFQNDPSFALGTREMDDPTAMMIDSKGNLYVCDRGKKMVYVFDSAGKLTNSVTIASPNSVFVDDRDMMYVAGEMSVVTPTRQAISFTLMKDGKPAQLEEIRSAAVNVFGEFFVVSGKAPGIQVYDQKAAAIPSPGFTKTEREFSKVLTDARNQVYGLDKQRKTLVLFAPDGRPLFTLGPQGKGFQFDKIDDFAVDRANHIYLLTKDPRGILIFSPSGSLLKYIPSEKKGGSLVFEDAKLIAVGPSGSIFILDKDQKRILKIG